jgi:hypothetical protein
MSALRALASTLLLQFEYQFIGVGEYVDDAWRIMLLIPYTIKLFDTACLKRISKRDALGARPNFSCFVGTIFQGHFSSIQDNSLMDARQ